MIWMAFGFVFRTFAVVTLTINAASWQCRVKQCPTRYLPSQSPLNHACTSCHFSSIYHDPCATNSPGRRNKPFLRALIVHRPRRDNSQSSYQCTCQADPECEMYIPVDISGDESNNLDMTERKRMMSVLFMLTIFGERNIRNRLALYPRYN